MGDENTKPVVIVQLNQDREQIVLRNIQMSSRIRRYDPQRRIMIKVKKRKNDLLNCKVFTIYSKPSSNSLFLKTHNNSYVVTYDNMKSLQFFLDYIDTFLINRDDEGMKIAIDFYCNL